MRDEVKIREEVIVETIEIKTQEEMDAVKIDFDGIIAILGIRIVVKLRYKYRVEAWENSSVEARGQSLVRAFSINIKLIMHGFSLLVIPIELKLKFKHAKTCVIQRYKLLKYLDREGVPVKGKSVIIYKKVSADFKAQEGTENETNWIIGTTLTHPSWEPEKEECGKNKFHAVSRPYFADEFRSNKGDRYIAIRIKVADLYEWPNPQYLHKIAFRKGKVLYEVDKFGKRKAV